MTRLAAALLAASLAGSLIAAGGSPAAAGFADAICPAAVPAVEALGRLDQPRPQQVADGAAAVSNTYETCAKQRLQDGEIEPFYHYDRTRAAQFRFVEARALLALGKRAEARALFAEAREEALAVAEWKNGDGANRAGALPGRGDHRPSEHAKEAQAIVDAADAQLVALSGASPAPAPSATP